MKISPIPDPTPSLMLQISVKQILQILVGCLLALWLCTLLPNPALARSRYVPDHGAPILDGNITGEAWLAAAAESRLAFCYEASAAFRGSAAQSYTISWNVQSLTAAGLCDRIAQYYAQEENLDTRVSAAAAIAPLLYADTPLKP
ncbi:MAG: hypothetical protein SFT94_00790 [Pseudanabaenaceae cyanobacterium bins.68]|nr:hypothetical protein [Pseudanabaenaceae cyanobacterium bins.68]